jgi:acyl-CoA thioester hydrolase
VGVQVWRGGVNTWECDEMGHMNVRFYVQRAMEGLAALAARLGMPDALAPHAESTLIVRGHHLRFLREARAGDPLHMTGGVVSLDETGATLLLVLVHSQTGVPAATMITQVVHARPRDGRGFPWPRRTATAAAELSVTIPTYAAPRSIRADGAAPLAGLATGRSRLTEIARGVIMPAHVDIFGRMRPDEFIGRVSDGIPALLRGIRQVVASAAPETPQRVGGAVLEYRLAYLDWPRCGDHVAVCSGLAGHDEKTQQVGHWMIDPLSGAPWAFAEAVAVSFDLDTRKVIPIADAARPVLDAHVRPDLRFTA